tara:strand:- start:119 stop:1060 length:942 start_codon:yes stop_codon:yes gene_type:complete
MIVSVTGSSGFIGKWLVKRLIKEGHEVREWDRHNDREIANFELEGADFVVHLAAMADVRASMLEPELWYENNVTTTTRIQRICNENKIPLVYASSSCIHAWWKSPYGTTKKINEETAFPGQVGLRFTTVYGEGARDSMFIGKLLRGEVKYATNHIRDFIHVSDVVDGIMLFVDEGTYNRLPAYNMGTGTGNTVSDVAHAYGWLGEITDGDDCEALDNTADNSDMREMGWEPKVDVIDYVKFQASHVNVNGEGDPDIEKIDQNPKIILPDEDVLVASRKLNMIMKDFTGKTTRHQPDALKKAKAQKKWEDITDV